MTDIYTPLDQAREEIEKRWDDKELENKIAEYLKDDVPELLTSRPHLVIFRNVIMADSEISRLLHLGKKSGLPFLALEYTHDRFVTYNPDKYAILMQQIKVGKDKHGRERIHKIKIADIDKVQNKPFFEIKTKWGENLVNFHHKILFKCYPEFEGKVFDLSEWLSRNGGRAKMYYEKFMVLLLRNCILAECFKTDPDEQKFMKEVILPSFQKVESDFGIRPLIVQLAPENWESDPFWWCPEAKMKDLIRGYIIDYKNDHTLQSN